MININIILLIILFYYSGIASYLLLVLLPLFVVLAQKLDNLCNTNISNCYLYFFKVTLILLIFVIAFVIASGGSIGCIDLDKYLSTYNISLFNESIYDIPRLHAILWSLYVSLTIKYNLSVEINNEWRKGKFISFKKVIQPNFILIYLPFLIFVGYICMFMGLNHKMDHSILSYIILMDRLVIVRLLFTIITLYLKPLIKDRKIVIGINPLSIVAVLCSYSLYLSLLDLIGGIFVHF